MLPVTLMYGSTPQKIMPTVANVIESTAKKFVSLDRDFILSAINSTASSFTCSDIRRNSTEPVIHTQENFCGVLPISAPIHERFLRDGRLQRTNRMAAAR